MLSKDTYFVIVHWGNQKLTQKAVLSVLSGARVHHDQVVVVENGAASGVASNDAKIISLSENNGYAAGVNAGVRYVLEQGAEEVLIMNNDLSYVTGAAEAMLVQAKNGFGCVGAIVSEGYTAPTLAGGFVDWFRGRTHFVFNKQDIQKMHYVSGAFLLVTRKCLLDVGDMPELYFHTWEDVAWGFEMRKKGWRLGFAETPIIPHLCSQSLSESKLKTYYLVRNGAFFIREYAPFFARLWLLGLEPLRLLWARIRGREEIVKALLDAKKGIGGQFVLSPVTAPGSEQGCSDPGAGCGSVNLSVIVVTHQSENDIGVCLESLKKESVGLNVEIIVVDAGSTDRTKKVVHQSCTKAKYIQLRNVGFAAAANLGATLAVGNIILFLNPDASLMPGALDMLEQRLDGKNGVGVVGGYLMSTPDIPEKWQAMPFPGLWNVLLAHLGRTKTIMPLFPYTLHPTPLVLVSWVSGGALCIRKIDFESVGGFIERFFLYFEDVDLCRRMKDLGFDVFLDSKMRVLHQGGKSTNKERRVQAYDRSQSTYFLLHRPAWEYIGLLFFRFFFRHGTKILLAGILGAIAVLGVVTNNWLSLFFLGVSLAVIVTTSRWPQAGIWLLMGSVVIGQTIRVNIGGLGGTVTDFLLLLVLVGLFYALVGLGYLRKLVQTMASGWWIAVAFLPGILLAWQRLPLSDFIFSISYTGRLFGLILLIPFLRILGVPFQLARKTILVLGSLLAGIGFFQLLVLPSLPPPSDTIFSQIFVSFSGGGWDPHQFRFFSTWLDPNFVGMFFVICLGLILGGLEKWFANRQPTTTPGAEQGCSAPGVARRFGLMLYGLVALVVFIALTLTRSRASFLALFVMLIVYFVFTKTKRIFMPIITVLGLALLIFPALSSRIFVVPLSDPTVQLRLHSWQQAIQHFSNFPLFGMGYNAYGVEQLAVGNLSNISINSLSGADNFILLLFVTVGLWGVSILAIGSSVFMAGLVNDARKYKEGALTILLALVALFVHSQFIQSFTYIHLLLPIVLLVGTYSSRMTD